MLHFLQELERVVNTKATCYDVVEWEDDTIFYPQIFKEIEAIFHLLFSITPNTQELNTSGRIVPPKNTIRNNNVFCLFYYLLLFTLTHLSQVTCEEEGRNKPKSIKRNTNTERKNQQKSLLFSRKKGRR